MKPISLDDFWSRENLDYKRELVEFARTLGSGVRAHDSQGSFAADDWQACAAFGIQGLCLPTAYGGSDQSIDRGVLAMEALGYGCPDNGLTFALCAQMWTTQMSILDFGSEEQKQRWLPDLAAGRLIAAQAITEEESGSDAYSLRAEAKPVDGGYVLNGRKIMITLGPVADVFLILATVNPKHGQWGVTAFLVPRDTEGLTADGVDDIWPKMGLRSVPLGGLTLEDCFVPEDARLGAEGAGASMSNASLEWERSCMLASQIGLMERQVELAVEYAKTREQFGRPIGAFQAVSHRIADMKTKLETSRLLVYRVAWLKSQGKSAAMEAAMAKVHLGESLLETSLSSLRTQGGKGYLTENDVERDLRDAVGTVLWGGTSDIQRVIIARLLGLKG